MRFRVWGLGRRVWGLEFEVQGLEFGAQGLCTHRGNKKGMGSGGVRMTGLFEGWKGMLGIPGSIIGFGV